jgi:uncharacterized protein with HEPN domain
MSRDWTFFLEDIQENCARVLRYTRGMTSSNSGLMTKHRWGRDAGLRSDRCA